VFSLLRKNLRKVVPTHAILPMCLTALSLLCSYQAAKLCQFLFGFTNATDLTTAFDLATPFLPGWVWIYLGSYFFWIYVYTTAARDSIEAACKLAAADMIGKLICLVFFLAFPTTNVRPEVNGTGLTSILMRTVYALDTPTNLFPSAHCFIAWLGTRYILTSQNLKRKWLHCTISLLGALLVFASTLYTKQHVIWDVFGAVIVAEIGILLTHILPLPTTIMKWNRKFMTSSFCKLL